MFLRQEDELDPTDGSETECMVMVSGEASSGFLAQTLNTKKINLPEKGDAEAPQYQESRIRFSRYCSQEFKSDKALGGHLRFHRQHQAKSKARIHHMKSLKPARKHSAEEEDDCLACFVCDDSFLSMKLLCQHMRNHREMDSNSIQEPIPSQGSFFLTEPETTFEKEINTVSSRNDQNQGSCIDFLKDIPNWPQTGKKRRQKIVRDKIDNIIYDAVPLRVYYGSTVPQMEKRLEDSQDSNQSLLTRKKQKTEETMPNQDASIECEFGAADSYKPDSESTVKPLGNSKQPTTKKISMMSQGFESNISNKSKSNSSHGRLKNPNGAKAVKIVHECEICGKTFQTGQALGGHKTYHRKKPVVDPFMGDVVQRKIEEQLLEKTNSSQTGKRRRQKTFRDKIDSIIYDAMPLRVYYGSTVPQMEKRFEDSQDSNQSLLTRKKQKTEETMPNQDASMECELGDADSYKPDSEGTVELLGNSKQLTTKKISMMSQGFESKISNKSKSNSSHGRLKNPNGAKAVKIVHECEICGKTFQKGQALGGHKTYHRKKSAVDSFMGELVQRKTEEQLSGETGQVRDYVTRMLLPWVLSGESDPSEETYQEHPKTLRLLGFDINIPYEG